MLSGASNVENSLEYHQKGENRNTLQSSNRTTGYLPKEHKNTNSKAYTDPCVYSSIIYSSQIMAQVSIDTRMDKDVVYVYNGILFSHRKLWA